MDIVLNGTSRKTGKSINIPLSMMSKKSSKKNNIKCNKNTINTPSNQSGNSTEFIDSDKYAYKTTNISKCDMKSILFMVGLPEDFNPDLAGRVYMLTINLRIFKSSINTDIPAPNDIITPIIGDYTLMYMFDTTWPGRIKPSNLVQRTDNLYYSYNNYMNDLGIYFDIIFNDKNNNLTLIIRTNPNQYYVIASSVTIDSVYPKITTKGDFVVDSKEYILPNNNEPLTIDQINDIAIYTQQILYG